MIYNVAKRLRNTGVFKYLLNFVEGSLLINLISIAKFNGVLRWAWLQQIVSGHYEATRDSKRSKINK